VFDHTREIGLRAYGPGYHGVDNRAIPNQPAAPVEYVSQLPVDCRPLRAYARWAGSRAGPFV